MTIEELQKALASIPPKGAINIARRKDIMAMINHLTGGGTA